MMPRTIKLILICLLMTAATGCSSIYGGTTSSSGDQSLSEGAPIDVIFEANVNSAVYNTVTYTNREASSLEIYNLAFVNNGCGAFSVFNITDASDNVLYKNGDAISVSVPTNQTVYIHIEFSPTPCETTSYTTNFIIFANRDGANVSTTVNLLATVTDNTPDTISCEEDVREYYDEYDNPTSRTLPPLPAGESYYLKVLKMNAYIQTTGGFLGFATQVGTQINLENIPEENWYQPVYIPLTTDTAGAATFYAFDECLGFRLPSPVTDTFFLGADVTVTMNDNYTGTIDRTNTPGYLSIPSVLFKLHSYINNSNSLLQSTDGFFDIEAELSLNSSESEENEYLQNLVDITDDDGEKFLNIENNRLVGKNIRHGTVTLVGIGQFVEKDDIKISNEGYQGLIESESYLFLQIEGLITQEKPPAESSTEP